MKPAPFDYLAPDSLEGALDALAEHGWDAKVLAGGQSLIPSMNFRLIQPATIVDINNVAELSGITVSPSGGVRIGAMTRQSSVERDRRLNDLAPLLAEAMPQIAHSQIRNRGTIGGSIAHADPAAELPVIAMALDAQFELQGKTGKRTVAASEFFEGMFETVLEPEELLTAIELPPKRANTGYSFIEVARRHGDYAIVGVAAWVTRGADGNCTDARLVYLNVGDRPLQAKKAAAMLVGQPIQADSVAAAADYAAANEIDPVGNVHGSAEFQRHLTKVLTRRAVETAWHRAAVTT